MSVIARLYQYMQHKVLTAYAVERQCNLSNGYLAKQRKRNGAIGSDILERLKRQYPDICLLWLITGKGMMLLQAEQLAAYASVEVAEEQADYHTLKKSTHEQLQQQIRQLEKALRDKEKIINLLESSVQHKKNSDEQ